jgi:malonate decarboxylase gamma subunit
VNGAIPAWQTLAEQLFPEGHNLTCEACFLQGTAHVGGRPVAVFGTTESVAVGVEMALASARFVLDVVRQHPGRSIVMLIDTAGQRLRHRDELLGINAYMAHLSKCVELARARGHATLGLVYGQAVSGGFITSGMMADACYALRGAQLHVMALPAMARLMRQPLETVKCLTSKSPLLGADAAVHWKMGTLQDVWDVDPASALRRALEDETLARADVRANLGKERGGRTCAADVIEQTVRWEAAGG